MNSNIECTMCGDSQTKIRTPYKNRTHNLCRKCADRVRSFIKCKQHWEHRSCLGCGSEFCSSKMKYCSDDCRYKKHLRDAKKSRSENPKFQQTSSCVRCGSKFSFVHSGTDRKFCSAACRRRAWDETSRSRPSRIERQPDYSVAFRILREAHWVCSSCGIKTPEKLRGTHELNAPEVDHIVPLSRGGTHEYENLQCLCKSCNSSKGAKLISEWHPKNDNQEASPLAA